MATTFRLIESTVSTHVAEMSGDERLLERVAHEEHQHRMEGIRRFFMVMIGYLLSMVAYNPSEWISTTEVSTTVAILCREAKKENSSMEWN